ERGAGDCLGRVYARVLAGSSQQKQASVADAPRIRKQRDRKVVLIPRCRGVVKNLTDEIQAGVWAHSADHAYYSLLLHIFMCTHPRIRRGRSSPLAEMTSRNRRYISRFV